MVDDDVCVNTLVTHVLRGAGYRVDTADDGEKGWDAVCSDSFDLLITDYSMPALNGVELLRRLRDNSYHLPAILMSADMPRNVGDILDLVASEGALHKPFATKDLLFKVGTILDDESLTRGSAAGPLGALGNDGRKERAIIRNAAKTKLTILAEKMFAHESATKAPNNSPVIFGICDKMRDPLVNLSGEMGFRSVLSRALALSKSEVAWLNPVKISASGYFEGLRHAEDKLTSLEISRGETVIIAQILGLLFTFLGESMTRIFLGSASVGFPLASQGSNGRP